MPGRRALTDSRVHGVLDFVNGTLAGSKGLVRRHGGRHVATVTRRQLGASINQEEVARLAPDCRDSGYAGSAR